MRTLTIPEQARRELTRLIAARGEDDVVSFIGVSKQTLARALAGLGVHRGTLSLIQHSIETVQAAAEKTQ